MAILPVDIKRIYVSGNENSWFYSMLYMSWCKSKVYANVVFLRPIKLIGIGLYAILGKELNQNQ